MEIMDFPNPKERNGFWEAYRECAEEHRVRPDRSPEKGKAYLGSPSCSTSPSRMRSRTMIWRRPSGTFDLAPAMPELYQKGVLPSSHQIDLTPMS